MDDYYSLLGVDADAPTADIRSAYRDKKAALEAKNDKHGIAALNKAWNVLSDPYQRGRYDAEREQATDGGELVEAATSAQPPARRGLFGGPPRERPPTPQPTIEPPPGTRFPEPRRRVTAMAIDLFVLLLFFVGSQVGLQVALNANHEEELDAIDAIDDDIERLDDRRNELEDDDAPQEQIDEIERQIDTLENRREDLTDELAPTYQFMNGLFFGVGFLYLVVPSALTGRTLGKKLQTIKVVRTDGTKLGWGGALYRYGLIVLGSYALSLLVPLLGVAIMLFIVMGWMRNANQQGLHDRLSKTLVVADATEDRNG